jgi:hypothetical protein
MRSICLVVFLVAASGAHAEPGPQVMCSLASSLTKVSKAVDGYVSQNPSTAATMRGRALLQAATQADPGMLDPFDGYFIDARAEGKNSSVLVCTSSGGQGLLEDAGCTARADAHLWREDHTLSCGFALDLQATCSGAPPAVAVNPCR